MRLFFEFQQQLSHLLNFLYLQVTDESEMWVLKQRHFGLHQVHLCFLERLTSAGYVPAIPSTKRRFVAPSTDSNSKNDISVTVQPEGMTGIVSEGINVDSDERIIMVRT